MTTNYPDDLVSELEASLLGRNDIINRWGNAISSILMFSPLRGFWPMSSVVGGPTIPPGGNANDLSGNGLTLTYNGDPTYNIFNGFVPYIDLDGTGDFLSIADTGANDPLDIIGTETYIASTIRGLTMSGWFRTSDATPAAVSVLMSKWLAAGDQRSFELQLRATGVVRASISSLGTGASTVSADSSGAPRNDTWFQAVIRFVPSGEISIFLDGVEDVNVAAIPAAIFNSTANFVIGGRSGGTNLFTGHESLCWICAASLPNATIIGLFEQQRVLFNV